MDLELTDEQAMLVEACDELVRRQAQTSEPDVRALWRALADFGLSQRTDVDSGIHLGAVEAVLVARSVGNSVQAAPLVGIVAVHELLAVGAADDTERVLQEILGQGDLTTVAVLEPGRSWGALATAEATRAGATYRLHGQKAFVPFAELADALLVTVTVGDQPGLAVVPAGIDGLIISAQTTLDPSLGLAEVRLDAVEVEAERVLLGSASVDRVRNVGALCAAAEAVGAAEAVLRLAREYATERVQFGHPIGSYQAVQHLLADAYVLVETSWSTVLFAAAGLDDARAGASGLDVSVAKAYTTWATEQVAHHAMQVFGGIAFTAEHPAHLYVRRIAACNELFGNVAEHELILGHELASARFIAQGAPA